VSDTSDATTRRGDDAWLAGYAGDDCIDVTSTGRRTGQPHEIEIWFGVDGSTAYLISGNGPTADWYRNMLAEPSVSVRFADGRTWRARARPVTDPAERSRVGDLMGAKYRWNGDPSIGLTRHAWCYEVPVIALEGWGRSDSGAG
jgi:deazaflavin-dependent oxidoreductase (nitroreductase family)